MMRTISQQRFNELAQCAFASGTDHAEQDD
jgi:hypothetical protein